MYANTNYTAAVSSQYDEGDNLAIWIDFDNSGTFDANELVTQFDELGLTDQNVTIAVPAGVPFGTHIMRVMCGYDAEPGDMDPCNNGDEWDYGEVHDYT